MRPILEIAVIIPGMLLAYLPVKTCLRQAPFKLGLWMFPLLLGISLSGGIVCYYFQIMTTLFLIPVLLFLMLQSPVCDTVKHIFKIALIG